MAIGYTTCVVCQEENPSTYARRYHNKIYCRPCLRKIKAQRMQRIAAQPALRIAPLIATALFFLIPAVLAFDPCAPTHEPASLEEAVQQAGDQRECAYLQEQHDVPEFGGFAAITAAFGAAIAYARLKR